MSFTAPTVSSGVSFSQWSGNLWNFEALFGNFMTWYGGAFGTGIFGSSLFAGSILLLIFGVQVVRQESVLLPGATVAIICSSTYLYGAVPADMQALFLIIFVVFPTVGVIYDIYRKR